VLFLLKRLFERIVEFNEVFELVGKQGFALIQLFALFFMQEVSLSSLLEFRILAVREVRVGCFYFVFGVGLGNHSFVSKDKFISLVIFFTFECFIKGFYNKKVKYVMNQIKFNKENYKR
jgi:hypothetical protein